MGPATALEFLERLSAAGVTVERARAAFQAGGKSYPEGTFVLPAGQPFRPYLVDLVEPQKYPELRSGSTGPTKRPYDIAGWTLSMQMGVALDRVKDRFEASLEPRRAHSRSAGAFARPSRECVVPGDGGAARKGREDRLGRGRRDRHRRAPRLRIELRRPRVALYQPWSANADAGWTEWLLDHYKIPYTVLHNKDFDGSDLRARFDSIILAQQTAAVDPARRRVRYARGT